MFDAGRLARCYKEDSGAQKVPSLFASGDEKALVAFLQLSGTIKLKGGPAVDSDMSVEKLQSIKEAPGLNMLSRTEAKELLKLIKTQLPKFKQGWTTKYSGLSPEQATECRAILKKLKEYYNEPVYSDLRNESEHYCMDEIFGAEKGASCTESR